MLVDAYKCTKCGNRGTRFYYDTNPFKRKPIHTCLMGVEITGEPGAIRCMDCDAIEGAGVESDGMVEIPDEAT